MPSYPSSWIKFIRAWARSPKSVGAIFETGPVASGLLADGADVQSAERLVLEVGAGTGSVTQEILPRLKDDSVTLMSIERDPELAMTMRHRFPAGSGVQVVTGDAIDIKRLLHERGLPQADSVVTAIPWTMLSFSQQAEMLLALRDVMASGTRLSAICYMSAVCTPGFWFFGRNLMKHFDDIAVEGPVLKNMPPCFIVSARKR